MTDPPATLINKAADLIEERAAAATPGPWRVNSHPLSHEILSTSDDVEWPSTQVATASRPNGYWIASLDPSSAASLALLLREIAGDFARGDNVKTVRHQAALTLAHRILGTEPEDEADLG